MLSVATRPVVATTIASAKTVVPAASIVGDAILITVVIIITISPEGRPRLMLVPVLLRCPLLPRPLHERRLFVIRLVTQQLLPDI